MVSSRLSAVIYTDPRDPLINNVQRSIKKKRKAERDTRKKSNATQNDKGVIDSLAHSFATAKVTDSKSRIVSKETIFALY
jgi:hypothetical protein